MCFGVQQEQKSNIWSFQGKRWPRLVKDGGGGGGRKAWKQKYVFFEDNSWEVKQNEGFFPEKT